MEMKTILVIDDEKIVRGTLRRILTSIGFTVIEASNGAVGIERISENLPNLVICDILMPTKEGIETIRELHRDYPELPIIAISGGGRFGTSDFLPHAEMFGAHAVLRKPFSVDEVIATVDALLGADGK